LLTVEAGEVVGAALLTPPYKLVTTRISDEALAPLAEFLEAAEVPVPGVLGPPQVAGPFARLWGRRRGITARLGMLQRIHACDRVRYTGACSGAMRVAEPADVPLLIDWTARFFAEVDLDEGNDPESIRRRVQRNVSDAAVYVWQDGETVSMVVCSTETPGGARIGPVFTPPEHRHKGYATACVAALTRARLEAGKRTCFLYTDTSNPTSNHIYYQIGYRPVCDSEEWRFE
jgi:predicted GNAT family acetyltransferase